MKVIRYILAFVLVAALSFGVVMLRRMSEKERSQLTCNKLEVSFTDSLKFVSEQNIRDYIGSQYGNFIGQRIDSVKLAHIEELLIKRSAIMDAQAWITDEGILHLSIAQRAPVLRFAYEGGGGFYVDEGGFIFPLHPTYTAPVRVVDGYVPVRVSQGFKGYAPNPKDEQWISDILALNSFLDNSPKWGKDIIRIFVSRNNELILSSLRGEEQFIFGGVADMHNKFSRIDQYYTYIAPRDSTYTNVNLKYKQQIICRKDI